MIMLAAILGFVSPMDIPRVIEAIEMAENTPWTYAGGGLQFTERTWREETTLPYVRSKDPETAKAIALKRLDRHAYNFASLNIQPTAYLLGSAWNRGFKGALTLHYSKRNCEYGTRVHNLYVAYTK